MFQKTYGKIKKISYEEIIECCEHNEDAKGRLEGAHEKFLDGVARVHTSRQPHVVKYVVDALMEEDDEGEDTMALTEEQKGFLFLLLKSVIDVLDQKSMKS
jgi:hypothetical protein